MTMIIVGMLSDEGDRLGHLVRGVQMLRAYGREFQARRISSVRNVQGGPDSPPLCCKVVAETETTPSRFAELIRETEWALGNHALRVEVLRWGDRPVPEHLPVFDQTGDLYMQAREFADICKWGQQLSDARSPVIGESPAEPGG